MSFKDSLNKAVEGFEMQEEAQKNITIDGKYIVIREQNTPVYEIPLDECLTVWGALEWITHMTEKTWVTTHKLNRIAGLMSRYAKEKHAASMTKRSEDNGL